MPAAETGAALNDPDEGLERIIVTARRRREELQDTPVSVVALSGQALEARTATNLRDLQKFVPNLTFAPSQNVGDAAANIFIRGIGQEDFLAGAEPGVGFYLDGIYVARSMGALLNLVDIDRVEVLRGPQGTLYGKNTIGGAINVLSETPVAKTEGYADLIAGNFGRFDVRGMINTAATDALFVRIAAGYFSRDGILQRLHPPFQPTDVTETNHEDEGREDSAAGRLQLRWLASDTLTFDLAADVSRRRGTQAATHLDAIDDRFGILPSLNTLIQAGTLPGPQITGAIVTDNLLESYAAGGNSISQNIEGLSATLDKELGGQRIRLITAYRRLRSSVETDLDGTWFSILQGDFRERHKQYSAELQLSGSLGRLDYTAGLFGFREETRAQSNRGVGRLDILYLCGCFYDPAARPELFATRRKLSGSSIAAFVQGNLRLTDKLSATLGGRYSNERKRLDVDLVELDPDTFQPTGAILRSGSNKGRWSAFTWRAGLEFRASPDLMAYLSAAKGYKSGGFNGRPVMSLPNLGVAEYDPETAITYELGVRSEWFHRRLRVNATLFHTSYRDIQLRQQNLVGGGLVTLIENAARARIRGIEVEAEAKLGDALVASIAYGHLDPEYLDVGQVPNLTEDTGFQRTPRHSFVASLDYSLPMGRHILNLHADYSYRSHEQFQLLASDFDQPGFGLLGARITWRAPADRWSIAIFGTNLTDERYRAAGRGTGIREVGIANSVVGLPRQVGVELRAGF